MFTGIVTDVGRVRAVRDTNRDRRFEIETSFDLSTVDMGASISHAGFILYATGDIDPNDCEAIKAAMRASKGPGNFRNMFVHAPNGKEGSIRVLPIAEVGAKDEFLGIKNATQADVMAAHRVPPQLLGIVPAQGAAFGNPKDATAMFLQLEIAPLQAVFLELNARLGAQVIRFRVRDPAG